MSNQAAQEPQSESPSKLSEYSNGLPASSLSESLKPERLPHPIERSPLFNLTSERRLAKLLLCTPQQLRRALRLTDAERFRVRPHTETRKVYDSSKKSLVSKTKRRELQIPTGTIEAIHRRLYKLLNRIEKPDYLHSGVKGRSYVSNARAHLGSATLAKADIESFFPSIKRVDIYNFFAGRMKCAPDIAGRLANLSTHDGHLPTGSPISQILAFWTFKPLFDEIFALASACRLKMTLYVDDIVVSGNNTGRWFLFRIRKAASRHGLRVHKLRAWSGGTGQSTGIVVAGQELRLPNVRRLVIREELRHLDLLREKTGSRALLKQERVLKRLIGRCWEAGQFDKSFQTLGTHLNRELNRIRRRASSLSQSDRAR